MDALADPAAVSAVAGAAALSSVVA